MKLSRTRGRRALGLGAALAAGALVLTACGTDDNSGLPGAVDFTVDDLACGPGGTLLASGSSAQANAMEVWVNTYQANCEGSQINYKATGSGAGVQEFLQGTTAFAGSDSLLSPGEVDESRRVCRDGGRAIHLPMAAGPIALGYNVPGVPELTLDASTLARIFDSQITRWNDPAIDALNPGVDLPDLAITPFHRSDGSGTTENLTTYLHASAPEDWPYEPDKAWRGRGGQSADGSSGLVGMVQQNEGAIAYFELSYAHQNDLDTVRVDTGASEPVEATVENSSNAIAEAEVVGEDGDLALELNYATREEGVYPIVLVTYEIVCDGGNDPATLELTRAFLDYTAGEEGQRALAEIDYAPISDDIIQQVRDRVEAMD
ncbi:phosphate ABC transporter substrate-binding protein PstS [Streptomyces sp. 3MP-14]|uniref:Phosphate-binding protein n=1 Tax=Streptomyces mimosae TaxID=2586635 RepID=A0A5N5ZSN7_9ACTN|nr:MULTISPECIES: phosphate ABC transporter substrate-binding protein PstS [Streptomyces]KAB8158340.1 phosphate ABC transporter substrate-binding protein PstS [Streptomyces mimosae]KAB8176875.1 phosphate ABC transporter substrate-binding protein PstS [Streptomyces sp. 3MP-14]